jgi:hypothetical protein
LAVTANRTLPTSRSVKHTLKLKPGLKEIVAPPCRSGLERVGIRWT